MSKFEWESWNRREEIMTHLEHLAINAIGDIVYGTDNGANGFHQVCGVLNLLMAIEGNMNEEKLQKEEAEKNLKDASDKAQEAYDSLFVRKDWLKKENANESDS